MNSYWDYTLLLDYILGGVCVLNRSDCLKSLLFCLTFSFCVSSMFFIAPENLSVFLRKLSNYNFKAYCCSFFCCWRYN